MYNKKTNAKVLLMDIETAPNLGYTWGKYEQNIIEFERDWYMLCFAAKWLDSKSVMTSALPDFSLYKKDKENDKEVVKALWKLFDEAEVLIAHNGNRFDIKKANARFLALGMNPPSPYQKVDTLSEARKYFKFDSNKLDDLGKYLGVGRKADTGGWSLWKGCMEGKPSSWKKMIKYNKQDVTLLEDVYLKLRPWINNHPNMNLLDNKTKLCPKCGSSKVQKRGFSYTTISTFQRWQCQSCKGWSRSRLSEKTSKPELKQPLIRAITFSELVQKCLNSETQ